MLAIALAVAALAAPGSFDRVATGFGALTYVTSAPSNPSTLYLVQQDGVIKTWPDGKTFADLSDVVQDDQGERGLLSIAFSPQYAQNGLWYAYYVDKSNDVRVVEEPSGRSLLDVPHPWPNHNGGQLQFDKNGFLYAGIGDGGTDPNGGGTAPGDPNDNAQNRKVMLGKLLRIDPRKPNATWQIVGFGLRNPWRFSFDRTTGDLWIGDVGAATYEEIDRRPKAKLGVPADYGWSRYEGTIPYKPKIKLALPKAYVPPLFQYSHAGGAECAIIGGYVAKGRYYYGDLCSGSIWSFPVAAKHPSPARMTIRIPNLTSFGQAADGTIYAVNQQGELYRLDGAG
ncbi:MAG: PQQ-dependent sugar dehydrogenase [Actinomycetota bacterium]